MKLTAEVKTLQDVMALVSTVVNPRHTNPLIQNVRFDATDGLIIRATDLDVSLQHRVDGVGVDKEGSALLPAVKLSNLLKDIHTDTVTLETQGDQVMVKAGNDRIMLQTADTDGFPSFTEFKSDKAQSLDARLLEHALQRTSKSIATDKGRYALNGVLITPEADKFEFCGTDGRRLAYARVLAKGKKVDWPIIVPRRGCELMLRLLGRADEGDVVQLDVRENELVFKVGDAIGSTNLVEGQYPDYWSVIPKSNDKSAVLNRSTLAEKVKLANHMTSVESSTIAFCLEDGELKLRTRSSGTGSAEVTVPLEYAGSDAKLGFDPRYVLEGLGLLESDDIVMEFRDNNTGVIFHEGKDKKEDYLFLVMPLEVD